MRFSSLLIVTLLSVFPALSHSKTIKIAAIDWCPQICPNQKKPGYVIDLVSKAFSESGYQLEIDYFPWSRAIKYVLSGQYHALLSPAKAEAPQLRYPKYAVGKQEMCFFTSIDSDWQYKGTLSLDQKHIGIAIDTSIEELNDYVENHPEQFQFQPYHERYIVQNAQKIEKGRIDAFLFTYNSTRYELSNNNMWHKYRSAGCVSSADIYMAFTPNPALYDEVNTMMQVFEQRMAAIDYQQEIEQLLVKYQLK